jgi:F0F1-type ATP synthase alpha subunit
MDINVAEIARTLRSQIEGFQQKIDVAEVGTVTSVGDGIARIHGLERVMAASCSICRTTSRGSRSTSRRTRWAPCSSARAT